MPAATRARASQLAAAALAIGSAPPPEVVGAIEGDRALFDKVVAIGDDDALGAFGPALAPAVAELGHPAVIAAFLQRGATRTAMWTALQPHLAAALGQPAIVDALGALCEPDARAVLAGKIAAPVLARIDRCIARRAACNWSPAAVSR